MAGVAVRYGVAVAPVSTLSAGSSSGIAPCTTSRARDGETGLPTLRLGSGRGRRTRQPIRVGRGASRRKRPCASRHARRGQLAVQGVWLSVAATARRRTRGSGTRQPRRTGTEARERARTGTEARGSGRGPGTGGPGTGTTGRRAGSTPDAAANVGGPGPATPSPSPEPDRRGVRAVLDVQQPCWIRVIADGEFVDEVTLQPGDSPTYRAKRDLQLRLGNAGGVTLRVNGEPIRTGPPGEGTTITFSWRDGDLHVERVTLS